MEIEESQQNSTKKEKERLKQIREEQKKALNEIKAEQNRKFAAEKDLTAEQRLKYLIQQTEIFTHFVSGSKKIDLSQNETKKLTSPTKRGKRTDLEDEEEILQESTTTTRLTAQPSFVTGTMRDYQLHGLNWLISLFENGLNGILADEMGLGKTLQTISFLCYLKNVKNIKGPHLVIAPKSTLANWYNEFHKWTPSLTVFKFHGSKDEREEMKEKELVPGKYNVIITSYEISVKEKAALKKFNWRYLIIDEAHRIKNEQSILSQVVRLYSSQYRLLLTGTPLQNNLHELWALLNFLLPDVFSSAEDFDSWFNLKGVDKGVEQQAVIEKLHKVLRPFLLRRLKADVERSLPPKREIKLFVGMSKLQKEWYQKILMKDIDAINSLTNKKEGKVRLLNIVMQLRKVCNHPYLFDGAEPTPYTNGTHLITNAGKLDLLDKLLPKLKAAGSRVLIFSQMTRMLDILEDYLTFREYEYCRIDGSTSSEDRENQIDEYNKPGSEKFVFLLSTRAGGLGINLATADTVILYDSDWNPQADLQAQDRAHRIGQTKPVNVYRLVTQDAIEQKIVERAETKLHLDALVIQQGRLVEQNKALSHEEMLSMIKFGADAIFSSKDSTITDEDIDAIIAKGEERTEAMNEKIKKATHGLFNWSLDEGSNLYEFQGVDYSKEHKHTPFYMMIEPPKRERKATYSVDKYYRDILTPGAATTKKSNAPKAPKQTVIYDFQFFPPKLQQLLDKEFAAIQKKYEKAAKKAAEAAENKDAKAESKDSTASKESADKEEEEEAPPLTAAEQAEKEKLMKSGFASWTRRDFNTFIKACERYGRSDLRSIAKELEPKTYDEVKQYSDVFWKKYKSLNDWERIVKNIEKGESKLKRIDEMSAAISNKVAKYKNPWLELKIVYGQHKGKQFTEDEDRFLICMIEKLGYGKWEELKVEIRKAWQFRFDWYLKSRTPQELQKRVETLVRLIEKESQDSEDKDKLKANTSTVKKVESKASVSKTKKRSPSPPPAAASTPAAAPSSFHKRRKVHSSTVSTTNSNTSSTNSSTTNTSTNTSNSSNTSTSNTTQQDTTTPMTMG